jgi:hypothetical protein
MVTLHPALARALTTARPIPLVEPVTKAALPANMMRGTLLLYVGCSGNASGFWRSFEVSCTWQQPMQGRLLWDLAHCVVPSIRSCTSDGHET